MHVVDGHRVVVVNCGDQPFPLSSDKLERIEAARGVSSFGRAGRCLASSACLAPSTTTIWEVMVVDRAEGDECLILSSDGLWDVVSNETTCEVALVYL
jgi:protein phosphatase 2C